MGRRWRLVTTILAVLAVLVFAAYAFLAVLRLALLLAVLVPVPVCLDDLELVAATLELRLVVLRNDYGRCIGE